MKILLSAMLFLIAFASKSQTYVIIPDAHFVTWLTNNFPSCMNGNQMDITCSDITSATSISPSNQQISNLSGVEYFTALTTLECWSNNLSALPPLPATLQKLDCNSNQFTSLPNLPANLQELWCYTNQLTSLPVLPVNLQVLQCDGNNLTALPALPATLKKLYCSGNNLTSLPTLPVNLQELSCFYNNLTSLPTLPSMLTRLWCNNNNISCFPVFPNSFPNSTNFYIVGNPFTCLPNYISAMDSQTLAYPLCQAGDMVNNPNGCLGTGGITGFTFKDINSDCIKNTGDGNVRNIPVKLYDNNNNLIAQTYTAVNGVYQFVAPPGTYTVKREIAGMPYTYLCSNPGLSSTVTLTNGNPLVTDVNFDIACKPGFDIGVLSHALSGWVFPGQSHRLWLIAGQVDQWYNLNCASGISGQVTVTVTGPVTYVGIIPGSLTPSVSGNTFTYAIANFGTINMQQDFGLKFTTNTTAQTGDAICVTVSVTPTIGDNNIVNNTYQTCYYVGNSYDPNLKGVYPQNVMPGYNDWLTYNIHFQNTGTAAAANIRVADTLHNALDPETFEVINYSHSNQTTLAGNAINFSFPNIMLPDSTSNPAGSQGFISYRIKLKPNLPAGTKVTNRASIYFDFNPPIVTNTALTTIDNPCPGGKTVITSNISGGSYQWQVDTGTGFVNIVDNANYSGAMSPTLNISNPPSSWYGYQYRCLVDANPGNTTILKFVQYWMGTANNQWENPLNWSCGIIPDANTDIIILSTGAMSPQPTISSNRSCRSLTVSPGGRCTVAPGFTLNILH